jgi:Leucine-rich repeat (LRR) protein
MLAHVILDPDGTAEVLSDSPLDYYSGPKDLMRVRSLEATADTRESSLSILGDLVPNLEKLRLNNSILRSIRDIGCRLSSLRLLSIARSGVTSLNGISTLSPALEELDLAFNLITDVSDLLGMDNLRILDLESNRLANLSNLRLLSCCTALRSLTLAGNPLAADKDLYVKSVTEFVPQLVYLDENRIAGRRAEKLPRFNLSLVLTEHIDDKTADRPPTARGTAFKQSQVVKAAVGKSNGSRQIVDIVRPLSSARTRPSGT